MTKLELTNLLLRISLLDHYRKFDGQAEVETWHEVIGHLAYDDATAAVNRHYGTAGSRSILPGDIVAGVQAIRGDRVERAIPPLPPGDPDDVAGYLAGLRRGLEAVADGTERPRPVPELVRAFAEPRVVPKPDWGGGRRFLPMGLRDRARRRAEGVAGPVVVDPEAT